MKPEEFKKLLIELKEEGANDDYPHQELAQSAQNAVENFLPDKAKLTDEQQEQAIQSYINGFCEAEQ